MIKVDIFGTCISRELFNYIDTYTVRTYLMQQSIYTIDSNSYPIDLEKIQTRDNYAFKNRMIYYDFNKLAFSILSESPSEYLIVDLADQSRDVVVLDNYDNIRLTATSAMLENLSRLGEKYHIENIESYSNEELYNYLKRLVQIFLSLYDERNIILNKIQMQNEYYVNNEKKYIDDNILIYKRRKYLTMLETIFLDLLPNCRVLQTKHTPILDINHRFGGPHPMHFEEIYYRYRMNLLDALINNKDINKIESDFDIECASSLRLIRSKTLSNRR